MAQENSLTPEKQLLKLIEESKSKGGPGGVSRGPSQVETRAIKYQGQSFFSFSAWLGRISFFKDRFRRSGGASGQYPDIVKTVNTILMSGIAVLGTYFIINLGTSVLNSMERPEFKVKPSEGQGQRAEAKDISLLKPQAYYLDKIRQKDIFTMGPPVTSEAVSKKAISILTEKTQDLKLVGISWSDDPDAMIEDTKMNRTFFVKKGQIIGELKVKDILKDKVVLSYGTDSVELR